MRDSKIENLTEAFGIAGVGYWITLLDNFAELYLLHDKVIPVEISIATISRRWKKKKPQTISILKKLKQLDLIEMELEGSNCHLSIPYFLKHYGAYGKHKKNNRKNYFPVDKICNDVFLALRSYSKYEKGSLKKVKDNLGEFSEVINSIGIEKFIDKTESEIKSILFNYRSKKSENK